MSSVGSSTSTAPVWKNDHLKIAGMQPDAPAKGKTDTTAQSNSGTSTQTTPTIAISNSQQKGIDVINKVISNSKLDDETKAQMVKAQKQAFGVTDAMLQQVNGTQSSTTTQASTETPTNTQKDGMKLLSQMLEQSNGADTAAARKLRGAAENIAKEFGLSQNMVNQTVENYAQGDQEKYVAAKNTFGKLMGFTTQG